MTVINNMGGDIFQRQLGDGIGNPKAAKSVPGQNIDTTRTK